MITIEVFSKNGGENNMVDERKKIDNDLLHKLKIKVMTIGEKELLEKNVIVVAVTEAGDNIGFTLKNFMILRQIILDIDRINRQTREDLLKQTDFIIEEFMEKARFTVTAKPAVVLLRGLIEREISTIGTPRDKCLRYAKWFSEMASFPAFKRKVGEKASVGDGKALPKEIENLHYAGNINISGGMVLISDPCWLERWKKEADLIIHEKGIPPGYIDPPLQHPFSYIGCRVSTMGGYKRGRFCEVKTGEEACFDDDTAFISATDSGVFPVYVELREVGNIGKRIRKIMIDFTQKIPEKK